MHTLTELAIEKPVSTIVGVLLIVIFGLISLFNLPIQLKPTIDKPIIHIEAQYPGAAPLEVEEVTNKFEEKLNSVEGLRKMSSQSMEGLVQIDLEFDWGVDRDARFVDVIQKLNQVEDLPEQLEKPIISLVSSVDQDKVMWLILTSDSLSVEEMSSFATKEVKDTLKRVEGVGGVEVFGERKREVEVILDPNAMAARAITVDMVRSAILRENRNVRGGYIDEGKYRYNVRTIGRFEKVSALRRLVVSRQQNSTVYLQDIARIEDGYERRESFVRSDGKPMIAVGIARKIGANTVEVTKLLEQEIAQLRKRFAHITYKGRTASLEIQSLYREADYVWQSLQFVSQNLVVGAFLAAAVLIFFLKSLRSTFAVAIIIPICFISIFLFLQVFGRTINIISLAGIAFAVGMTVDNAIVVIENIYRHLEMGKSPKQASREGTQEVWGAVLASTLTTMVVFLPILYFKEEAGELFRDIALTISISVAMSLVLSLTVIPMLSSRLLQSKEESSSGSTNILVKILFWLPDRFGGIVRGLFTSTTRWSLQSGIFTRIVAILLIIFGSGMIAYYFSPPLEYLPSGNRNFIVVFYEKYPGLNLDKSSEISQYMEERITPLQFDEKAPKSEENRILSYMFAVVSSRFSIIGFAVKDKYSLMPVSQLPQQINPHTGKPFLSSMDYVATRVGSVVYDVPGTKYAFAVKPSLFGNFKGKHFLVEIRGPKIEKLQQLASTLKKDIEEVGQNVGFQRVIQDFEIGLPEIHARINREQIANLGLNASEVADVIEIFVAGRKTGKFRDGLDEIDIVVRGEDSFFDNIDNFRLAPFVRPDRNGATTIETVADIYTSTGPTTVFHKEQSRAITLEVNLPEEKPLEESIDQANQVIDRYRKGLPAEYHIELTGTASDLDRTVKAFLGSFLLSIVIVYLLMASLFESFFYPFIMMLTVPLAVSGGIFAVYYNAVPMDMLTVLGFIILCGIVVNNAILVVHQALNFQQQGMPRAEAIQSSVESRLRPVFMGTVTTVFGLLPMCLKGSPGSELYSGLGTAIAGGLIFSTLFTLVLVPLLLSLLAEVFKGRN